MKVLHSNTVKKTGLVVGLLAVGYVLGASGILQPDDVRAQVGKPEVVNRMSGEGLQKIKGAVEALQSAQLLLEQEQKLVTVTGGLNAFLVLSGGGNIRQDLENGRGVDPETFAALHAGLAQEPIQRELSRDFEGRLTFKGKIVRMYSVKRLKKMFEDRQALIEAAK